MGRQLNSALGVAADAFPDPGTDEAEAFLRCGVDADMGSLRNDRVLMTFSFVTLAS
jgi:hypothetical protein